VRLGVVPSYEDHPLPRMLAADVPVSLNADDPYWFGSSIAQEYQLALDLYGLSDADLAGIARSSTLRTGMTEPTRQSMVEGIDAWLREDGA
jgi:adenosine deaminase